MKPEQVLARMFEVPVDEISDATTNEEIAEWDSLGHVNLVLQLETTFGVSLTTEDALAMKSVGEIKRILRERGASW